MTNLERMRKTLLQTDGEFRRLSEEHRDLDTLIGELSHRLFQTSNDEIEKATLKKRKLQIKDRMEVILRQRCDPSYLANLEPTLRG